MGDLEALHAVLVESRIRFTDKNFRRVIASCVGIAEGWV